MQQVSWTESVPDSTCDTVRIPALAELQQQFLSGVDPYQSASQEPLARERARRRTLDDMRRLSETIKRARAGGS